MTFGESRDNYFDFIYFYWLALSLVLPSKKGRRERSFNSKQLIEGGKVLSEKDPVKTICAAFGKEDCRPKGRGLQLKTLNRQG